MRAVVLDEQGQPAHAEVPEPQGDGELVRVLACGLCGSDLEKIGAAPPGTVLGHEVVGEKAGARVRMHAVLLEVEDRGKGRLLLRTQNTFDIEGEEKPALSVESLALVS